MYKEELTLHFLHCLLSLDIYRNHLPLFQPSGSQTSCLSSELSKKMAVHISDSILKSQDEEWLAQTCDNRARGVFV